MEKHYPFREFEKSLRQQWEQCFSCHSEKEPYTIIMPPPNVTGSLHMGHALSSTLQDLLIRFYRMCGRDALWLPGTDHAGIATQVMVEKQLAAQGLTRQQLGREAFLKKVWEWKEHHGGVIVEQMKRMGFSADWSCLTFTMDPAVSQAVRQAFITLYNRGLIYRARRLINWDTLLQTALSDLEITTVEEPGTMWTLRYALEAPHGHQNCVEVATTRPETIFGDVAVAVHPQDIRYAGLVGKNVRIPLIDRLVPVIADTAVDPQKGTGAVKITPAHDFLDFEIGARHHLPHIDLFDASARLNDTVPPVFRGMDVAAARRAVVEALGDAVVSSSAIVHAVPISERSGCRIEPRLTYQWFVDTKVMAEKAKKAVENGETTIIPSEGAKRYFGWLDNIQPWCISRQLWWGHQIPVWFGPEGRAFAAHSLEEAQAQALQHFGAPVELVQDEDVLDTWFSSALWPFSTLGWPQSTEKFHRYYPTDLLVTGHDILFFWVARMMMMGLELTGKIPFRTVYLHPLVQDEKGKKMSKTKGNVINPLDIVDEYGADAVRFALIQASTPTQHISFGVKQVEHARNFLTKIWNVARFLSLQGARFSWALHQAPETRWDFNTWIIGELCTLHTTVRNGVAAYRFHEIAATLYQFLWNTFCDRYIEFAKDHLRDGDAARETQETMGWVFRHFLKLLHPLCPFITEHLWSTLSQDDSCADPKKALLCMQPFCVPVGPREGSLACGALLFTKIITAVRNLRAEFSIPAAAPLELYLYSDQQESTAFLQRHQGMLARLLHLTGVTFSSSMPKDSPAGTARVPLPGMLMLVPLSQHIDIQQQNRRLGKALEKEQRAYAAVHAQLANEEFLANAPKDVIANLEERRGRHQDLIQQLREALQCLT